MGPQELPELQDLLVNLEHLDQEEKLEHQELVDQLVTQEMLDQWDLPEVDLERKDLIQKILLLP